MTACKKEKCLIEGCPNEKIYARGLCPSHYQMIRKLVKDGKRSWEEFEKVGMSLRSEKGKNAPQRKRFEAMAVKNNLKICGKGVSQQ